MKYASTGVLVQETVWLGDIPAATLRPNGANVDVFYVHTDQLNTPRKVSRPSDNQLRWRWDPTPFGEGTPNENPAALGAFKYNLQFSGQYFDLETNLNYNYFRDYDPAIGRYVQSDPAGLKGGLNTFEYVEGRPVEKIDPLGLNPVTGAVWGGNAGTAIGALGGPPGAIAGRIIGTAIGAGLGYLIVQCATDDKPACNPPVGTVCFHIDRVPPSTPHFPIEGSHYHLWRVNQAPDGSCHWNYVGASKTAPPGAIACPFARTPTR